jgi:hypothetical protein
MTTKATRITSRTDGRTWMGGVARVGATIGISAGGILLLWNASAAALGPGDLWAAIKAPAFPLLREMALAPGFETGAVLAGLGAHYLLSIMWGVLFAASVSAWPRPWIAYAGIMTGALAWVWMQFVVLPVSGAAVLTGQTLSLSSFTGHLVFGAALAVAYFVVDARSGGDSCA